MSKVGSTSSFVFSVLGQFCWYTANGHEVRWSPYPDVPEDGNPENRITFLVADGNGAEIDSNIKDALNVGTHLFSALGNNKDICIERLPLQEDEEAKYTITIKKQQNP